MIATDVQTTRMRMNYHRGLYNACREELGFLNGCPAGGMRAYKTTDIFRRMNHHRNAMRKEAKIIHTHFYGA